MILVAATAQVRIGYRDPGPVADGRRNAGTGRVERNIGDAQAVREHPRWRSGPTRPRRACQSCDPQQTRRRDPAGR